MKDSLTIENHGVTLGLSNGINLGVTITDSDGKMMNAQIEYDQLEEIEEFLEYRSKESEKRKRIINDLSDRNEELRNLLKSSSESNEALISACESIMERYDSFEDLRGEDMLAIRLSLPYAIRDNRLIKKEIEE